MGRGSSGANKQRDIYERLPSVFRLSGGSRLATPEQKRQRQETISRFIDNAKEGNVYSVGGGFGSTGGQQFEVVRSRGKLALKWQGSNRQPVQLNRSNVEAFIGNGATLVKKKAR